MRADEVSWNRAVLAVWREGGGDSLACRYAAPVMEQLLVLGCPAGRGVFERDLVYSKSVSQSKIKGNEVLQSV